MTIAWLGDTTPFPAVDRALREPDGLLAAGGELSIWRLTQAYRQGIFPWFSEGEPVLWWSPDPRMVLQCANFSPGHSLRKRLRQIARQSEARPTAADHPRAPDSPAGGRVEVWVDTAFDQVLAACAAPRDGQPGTWITPVMQQAYRQWHLAGTTHSVETWIDGRLAGGLYGVSLGAMFFGESMFTRATDASKIALAYLVTFLARHGVQWIDCQQQTRHLASLGAAPVSRTDFATHIAQAQRQPAPPWCRGRLTPEGRIMPMGQAANSQ